jgi:hypothetical protein
VRCQRRILQYVTLVIPLNQLTSVISTCLQLDLAAGIAAQHGAPTPTVADYFVLTYTDYTGSTIAGPGACLIASALSIVVYAVIICTLAATTLNPCRALAPLTLRDPCDSLRARADKFDILVFLRPGGEPTALSARARVGPLDQEDEDVAAERARVEAAEGGGSESDWVAVQSLRKEFGPGCCQKGAGTKVAVDSLSLGVAPGTCFALLGPNGAGSPTRYPILYHLTLISCHHISCDTWQAKLPPSRCSRAPPSRERMMGSNPNPGSDSNPDPDS